MATHFVLGTSAKVRCTYVQPGQGRIPRAPGRLSHSCRIVHAQNLGVRVHRTRDDRCSCKRDAGSPLRSSPAHVGRLRLHSACINPRDRPRVAPSSAMPNAARRRAPTAAYSVRARRRKPGERPDEPTKPTKKRGEHRRKKCKGHEARDVRRLSLRDAARRRASVRQMDVNTVYRT